MASKVNETEAVERLKADLLEKLRLMTPRQHSEYWRRTLREKPDLEQMARGTSPVAQALQMMDADFLRSCSVTVNPFAALLDRVDLVAWANFCTGKGRLHL